MCQEISIQNISHDIALMTNENADTEMDYLEQSIALYGLLCPILVRVTGDGFKLVSGRRRLLACRNLGYDTVPAVVLDITLEEARILAFQENFQRSSFNAVEEADVIDAIRTKNKLDDEDLCDALSVSINEVNIGKRLHALPDNIKQAVLYNKLTDRQALSLSRIPDKELQTSVFQELITHQYSSGDTEDLVTRVLENI